MVLLAPPAASAAFVGKPKARGRGPAVAQEIFELIEELLVLGQGQRIEVAALGAVDDPPGSALLPQHMLKEERKALLALAAGDMVDPGAQRKDAFGHFAFAIGAADDRHDARVDFLAAIEQRDAGGNLFE
jgi:hypothetical protein